MRTALLISLLVHGAAAAGLALLGVPGVQADPGRPLDVSIHADVVSDIEPAPAEPAFPDPPVTPETWEFPAEEPVFEGIDAPEAPVLPAAAPVRPVRLPTPLARPARARAAVAPAAPRSAPHSAAARVTRTGEVRPPRLLADASPAARYPARARRMGLEGCVVLRLRISADGTVTRVEVASSSGHEELDRAAADAAAHWTFEPARRDGVAIAYDVRVPVEFRLTDAQPPR